MPAMKMSGVLLTAFGLAACAGPQTGRIRFGDAAPVRIAGLDTCAYRSPGRARLDPEAPLVVLVHGCNDSGGRFRVLAEVFEAQGQQTICFNYDDRDSLETSASRLARALEALLQRMDTRQVTVIGHSQGGLVARRAFVHDRPQPLRNPGRVEFRLVTVSSPLGGIEAASHCGILALHILSFGVSAGICQIATGSKWTEIHPVSWFMVTPGAVRPDLREHLKVITDERGFCLERDADGDCAESDDVFSTAEQYNPVVDADARVTNVEVRAGHVEIVGDQGRPPTKLVRILQRHGYLAPTEDDRRAAFDRRLHAIYRKLP
jgi:pimeloyl-ACP methyl ester carboxylesterase